MPTREDADILTVAPTARRLSAEPTSFYRRLELSRLWRFPAVAFPARRRSAWRAGPADDHYRRLFEDANDILFTLDLGGRLTDLNAAGERLLGYRRAELVGATLAHLVDPASCSEIRGELARKIDGAAATTYEIAVRTREGRRRQLELSTRLLFDDAGRPAGVHGSARDITERKAAEQALGRRAELLDLSFDAVVVRGMDGVITYWNRSAESIYGWSRGDALGRVCHELLQTRFHPQSLPLDELLLRDGSWEGELWQLRRDGVRITVESRQVLLRDDMAAPTGVMESNHRLSSRTVAEAALRERRRFRMMADTAPVLIWMSGVDGYMTYFNRPWLEFTGRTMEEQLGRGFVESVHPDDYARCRATYAGAFNERRPFTMELRLRHHSGEYRWVLVTGVPCFEDAGAFTGYIGSCIDITDRISAETRLAEEMAVHMALNAQLQETAAARDRALAEMRSALRMRDEFVSSVSHDLRTPLSTIGALVQLLRRRAERQKMLESARLLDPLTMIARATARMEALVDDLLDLARLQGARPLELNRRIVDLVTLAEQVAADHRRAASGHRITVLAEQPALVGMWDPARLERVISNLIANAVRYSPEGGPVTVTVGTRTDGAWAAVTVTDLGLGIPEADLPFVFDRFHRGRNVVGKIKGTGVGLATVRQIAEQHGGCVEIASTEGEGTTVSVWLPLRGDVNAALA